MHATCIDFLAKLLKRDMEKQEPGSTRRAEIDTRAPFRSVKEAVMIFGERVLAGEVYANKLNQIRAAEMKEEEPTIHQSSLVAAELEETNQHLERARQESQMMANCLTSLKEELERTRMELIELKARESTKQFDESEVEDIKFVENAREIKAINESPMNKKETENFQRKRSVKFVNPPIQMMMNSDQSQAVLERQFSVDRVPSKKISVDREASHTARKNKKKKFMPMITAVFSKKKGFSHA